MQLSLDTENASAQLATLQDSNGHSFGEQTSRNRGSSLGASKRPARPRGLQIYAKWAALLSIVTIVVILAKCTRFPYTLGSREGVGRQLAGLQGTSSEEDPELDAVLQLCLEMEESYQPHESLPHMQLASHRSFQDILRSLQEVQTSEDRSSVSVEEGPLPYFSPGVPQSQQEPGTQTGSESLAYSADFWGAPDSPGEGPSTSAWGSTLLSSVITASTGYSSPKLPVGDRAPSLVQGPHVQSPSPMVSEDLPSGGSRSGLVSPQVQLRAHPQTPTQPTQPNAQRDTHSGVSRTLSERKTGLGENGSSLLRALLKRPTAFRTAGPGTPEHHETAAHAFLASSKKLRPSMDANRDMTQGSRQNKKEGRKPKQDKAAGLRSSESASSPLRALLVPSTSRDADRVSSPMHQASDHSKKLIGSPGDAVKATQGAVGATASPKDNSDDSECITSPRRPSSSRPLSEHPFYRTPGIKQGVTARQFSLAVALKGFIPKNSIDSTLRMMRILLLQDVVNETELGALVSKMEALAGHLLRYHSMPVRHLVPQECVRVLGIRYLILDALFVGSKVLELAGQNSNWWKDLVENIPCDLNFQYSQSYGKKFKVNVLIAKELNLAIRLLKARIRPREERTILLKRLLLCKGISHPYFKHRNWDPWRDDEKNYSGNPG